MTDRDLMQQAMEALEFYYDQHGEESDAKVITAMRERLAQPEQTVSMTEYKRLQDLVTSQGIRLMEYESAQPEQKPFCYHDGRNIVGKEYAHHCDVFPLYTHPAAQQPLTDEQFNRIPELYVIPPHHVEMVVRAIEATHGIKEKP